MDTVDRNTLDYILVTSFGLERKSCDHYDAMLQEEFGGEDFASMSYMGGDIHWDYQNNDGDFVLVCNGVMFCTNMIVTADTPAELDLIAVAIGTEWCDYHDSLNRSNNINRL